jgi:poly-gamma-glutamate capsule biosynthesis protein CapA/YwtB (metallophosphatase superfamily)
MLAVALAATLGGLRAPCDGAAHAAKSSPPEIVLTGDILLAGRVQRHIEREGPGAPFAGVRDVLRWADLTVGNLECALATVGQPAEKTFTFCAHPHTAAALTEAGFDLVSLANNHSVDYGAEALLETVATLSKHGVLAVGAGRDLREARRPAVFELGTPPMRVAVLAFSNMLPTSFYADAGRPGTNPARPAAIANDVASARALADVVIVLFHCGTELSSSPSSVQRQLASTAVEAGADLVVGHHPHVLQGVEVRGHALIAYSLGNFLFPSRGAARRTIVLRYTPERGGGARAELIPCVIDGFRPLLASARDRDHVLRQLAVLSRRLGTDVPSLETEGTVRVPPRPRLVDKGTNQP